MAESLQAYLYKTRRLLHDATGGFYSDNDLANYILEARARVARDTGCMRVYAGGALTAGTPSYDIDVLFPTVNATLGVDIIDVLGITLDMNNTMVALKSMPWTVFAPRFRTLPNFSGWPIAFARYGQDTIWFGPTPSAASAVFGDLVVAPTNPGTFSTVATTLPGPALRSPFTEPVPYYAAYLAKQYEQSYGEALQVFLDQYNRETKRALTQFNRMSVRFPYAGR